MKVFGNIDTADLQEGAVTGDKIAPSTIGSENIIPGTIPPEYTDANVLAAVERTYIDDNGVWTPQVYANNVIGGTLAGCLLRTIPIDSSGAYIAIYKTYIEFFGRNSLGQIISVFKLGTVNYTDRAELIFGNGCSIDVSGSVIRLKTDDNNYIRVNANGGGVDYVKNGTAQSLDNPSVTPVFG
jgi:hypothetical protein